MMVRGYHTYLQRSGTKMKYVVCFPMMSFVEAIMLNPMLLQSTHLKSENYVDKGIEGSSAPGRRPVVREWQRLGGTTENPGLKSFSSGFLAHKPTLVILLP